MPIQFQSRAQEECYQKVERYMRELFGEMCQAHPTAPTFAMVKGSAMVTVTTFPWGDADSVVMIRSYVVFGAELTKELLHYLLVENFDFRFGAFGVDRDGDIFFGHNIVGSTLDKNELKASVLAVLGTADDYDDKIQQRFGGMRAADRAKS